MNISEFKNCSNCGACYNLCSVGAIKISDGGLFYKPVVDSSICVDCGKCVRVCPVNNELPYKEPVNAYSAVNKDAAVVAASSSGGAFSALYESVKAEGGVIYSAVYSDDFFSVKFDSSDNRDIDEFRRSKYTESLVGEVFSQIHNQLKNSRKVLFCGTPCQTAGLKNYLGKDFPSLITCDFSCGGLVSHKIYADYLHSLEKRYSSRVNDVNFRPKAFGWRIHSVKVSFDNKKSYVKQASLDPYFSAFLYGRYSIRDYCAKCVINAKHQSDIVLADFWLTKQISGEEDDDSGISLLIAMTEKGESVIKKASKSLKLKPVPLDKATYNFKTAKPKDDYISKRKEFLKAFENEGIFSAGKRMCMVSGIAAIKTRIRGAAKKLS